MDSFSRKLLGIFTTVTAVSVLSTSAFAQTAKPDSVKTDSAPKPKPASLPVSLSGTMFGNFQYQGAKGPSKSQNKFEVERAYLTLRANIAEKTSTRITLDIYQPSNGGGFATRLKYAYLQYDYLKTKDFSANARIGMLQTGLYEYEETFWPRWLSPTPLDRAGYFSSADLGISTIVTFPNKLAEAYVAVLNGTGYSATENNRFKDYEARVIITPLASSDAPAVLKSLSIVPHYHKGTNASKISGDPHGLKRDRYGVLVALRDPRFTAGFDFAQRTDGSDTLIAGDRNVSDTKGQLISAYTTLRPVQLFDANSRSPLGVVLRYDDIKPNKDEAGRVGVFIGGLTWEMNKKFSLALDYQESTPRKGATGTPSKLYYLHWVANF